MLQRDDWALVTGASSGLGEELARALAARGVSLVLTARSVGRLESLAAELGSLHGIGTRVLGADLSVSGGIDRLQKAVAGLDLEIAHLFGNAGYGAHGPVAELELGLQRRMITLNCEAITALTGALLPPMIARGRGGILNVASTAAFQPAGTFATYAATKAFVLSFTEALHEEVRGTGVHVTALCPGPVRTGFQARAGTRLAPGQEGMLVSPRAVVRQGLAAYERGDAVCIPGRWNRVGALLASKGPRALVRRVAHRVMKGAGE